MKLDLPFSQQFADQNLTLIELILCGIALETACRRLVLKVRVWLEPYNCRAPVMIENQNIYNRTSCIHASY